MKIVDKLILFILAVFLIQCHSVEKSKTIAHSNTVIPDSLYPSPGLVVSTHNDWTKNNYPKMIALFKTQPLQMHDIVFLGNSITRQGGDWGKRLNNSSIKNRGIAGDVTDGVLARLAEITYIKPRAVFLEIGINDLFNDTLSPQRTAANIIKITEAIHRESPRTKIYVQTVFPTNRDSMISRVRETNDGIRSAKRKVFTLIDTHALFADEQDKMKAIYTRDGVHLTEAGYEVWVNHLKKYLK